MADIRSVLDRLIVIQAAVSITDPITTNVLKAWKYIAPQNTTIPETPCFMNDWTDRGWEAGSSSVRIGNYQIHSMLYVQDADLERALDIATALYVAYRDDVGHDMTLDSNAHGVIMRGADPSVGTLERAGKAYIAVETFLDFQIKGDGFTWS